MYTYSETRPAEWIRFGDTLVHLRNVNTINKKGDGVIVRFADGKSTEMPDVSIGDVADAMGFRKVNGNSTAKQK